VHTTVAAHQLLVQNDAFVAGTHTTTTVEGSDVLSSLASEDEQAAAAGDVLLVEGRAVRLWNPAMSASAAAATHGAAPSGNDLVAPMQGTVVKVLAEPGQDVEAGEPVVVLEAMKMETAIAPGRAGKIASVSVVPGDTAAAGQVVATLE
jgi:acetyl-CoA/propionyl-CoA carboxylase biotin carboxyl carrier protein